MTQTGYSNAIISTLLGWLKGLANWVLKLFDLAGGGASPLLWLSRHWLQLLVVLLIVGVGLDLLVWMLRWRPHWAWFKRKRVVVNDERILSEEEVDDLPSEDILEQRYVVPNTVAPRPKRRAAAAAPSGSPVARTPGYVRPNTHIPERSLSYAEEGNELFEVGHDAIDSSDYREDKVFNVTNLPGGQTSGRRSRRRRRA